MKKSIFQIIGLLLLLPLFSGCNDSDDVAAIFTGKTWKLNYITVDGGHEMFGFWENEAEKKKSMDELKKNGTYNVIFEGTTEDDLIKGNIRGALSLRIPLPEPGVQTAKTISSKPISRKERTEAINLPKIFWKVSRMRHLTKGTAKIYTFCISLPEVSRPFEWSFTLLISN